MNINFSRLMENLVARFGDREALVHVERQRRYSFGEFHAVTNQIANMIREDLKLGYGDCFVNIVDNDNMSLLHFATIFKGKATGAFTNYRDALSEHTWQVECSKAKVAFIENELLDTHYTMLRDLDVDIVCMDPLEVPRKGVRYFWDLVDAASTANPDIDLDDRQHCAIIRFTGGTTGKGKPAMYCVDNWLGLRDSAYALPDKACWAPESRMLHIAPISHGSGMFFVPTLFSGGCTVTQNLPDLMQYARNIEAEKITTCFLVPTILYRLLEIPGANLSSMQYMFYGAAPMSPAKLKILQERFGNIFVQVYGSTEHFGFASSLGRAQHQLENEAQEVRLASAGQPTAGIEVVIVDGEDKPLSAGETGEIWLRSRCICMGYLNNPEQTEKEFHNGYWKSGDLGYLDEDGFVFIVDRKKDMIISGGFNIYATEVEAVINAHPGVLMSAVVGVPDEEWGEAVLAEVKLTDGASADAGELRQLVKDSLGSYKAPKQVIFVDELPMSVVGKVLRRKVREKYWKGNARQVG